MKGKSTGSMIYDYEIINNINIIMDSNIIIYGCGYWGKQVCQCLLQMGKNPAMVCETHSREQLFNGRRICSIKDIKNDFDSEETLILVCSNRYYEEMIDEYSRLNFQSGKIATVYAFFVSLRMHCGEGKYACGLEETVKKNMQYSRVRFEYHNKLYAWDMMMKAADSEESILVYQPGKVGSQSIWHSIRQKCIQFHTLAVPYGCKEMDDKLADYCLEKLKSRKKLKIITAVREPIVRDLSAMFQNSELGIWPFHSINHNIFWWYGDFYKDRSLKLDGRQVDLRNRCWQDNLSDSFSYIAGCIMDMHLDEFSWFDYELKNVLGIDIFQYPFDKEKGYSVIVKDNIEVLVLKTEKLSQLQSIIAGFLQDESYLLDKSNESDYKIYKYTYKELKKSVKIDRKYYNFYYKDNDKLKHFYSQKEIDEFMKYWKQHIQ